MMDITKCINEIKNLPPPRKTFMEILEVNRSEVHVANLLAYFFRSEESHELGDTFLKALFETNSYCFNKTGQTDRDEKKLLEFGWNLNPDSPSFGKVKHAKSIQALLKSQVKVTTEEITERTNQKQKRIDLVVQTDECVVCIEFKINHELNNPLEIYQNQIKEMELEFQQSGKKPRDLFFIALSPYKKAPNESVQKFIDNGENVFREVILSHFVANIVKNIPANYFIENVNTPHSQYLVDFIQTINNRAINHWRTQILLDLKAKLPVGLKTVHEPRYFGFLQFHSGGSRYKIRIRHNNQFVIEKWTKPNGKDYELEKTYKRFELSMEGYEAVLASTKEIKQNPTF